jgi:hypothetical protein
MPVRVEKHDDPTRWTWKGAGVLRSARRGVAYRRGPNGRSSIANELGVLAGRLVHVAPPFSQGFGPRPEHRRIGQLLKEAGAI